jgi:hypothetical protein
VILTCGETINSRKVLLSVEFVIGGHRLQGVKVMVCNEQDSVLRPAIAIKFEEFAGVENSFFFNQLTHLQRFFIQI